VPRHQKPAERLSVDRLDFLTKPRQRSPPKSAQYIGIDPLAFGSARAEFAFDDLAGGRELQQKCSGDADAEAVTSGELARGERSVRSRVSEREIAGRISGSPAGSGTPSASR
jgi:hypothetical protein